MGIEGFEPPSLGLESSRIAGLPQIPDSNGVNRTLVYTKSGCQDTTTLRWKCIGGDLNSRCSLGRAAC